MPWSNKRPASNRFRIIHQCTWYGNEMSSPRQFQQVIGNADGGATCWLATDQGHAHLRMRVAGVKLIFVISLEARAGLWRFETNPHSRDKRKGFCSWWWVWNYRHEIASRSANALPRSLKLMKLSPLWNARNELWMQRFQSNRMAVSLWGSPGKSVCSTATRSSCSSQHQWQSIQSWLNPLVCHWFWHVTLDVDFDERTCLFFLACVTQDKV